MDVRVCALDEVEGGVEQGALLLGQVVAIERASFPAYESLADHLRAEARARGRTLLVARPRADLAAVAGYLLLERRAVVVHVTKLAVAEQSRRRGVGRALLLLSLIHI